MQLGHDDRQLVDSELEETVRAHDRLRGIRPWNVQIAACRRHIARLTGMLA